VAKKLGGKMEAYYESRKDGDFKLDPATILSLLQANGKDILNQMFAQLPCVIWFPIPHETIEGVYVNKFTESTETVYVIENEKGAHALVGTPSLDEQMKLAHLGNRLKIQFTGLRDTQDAQRSPAYKVWRNTWTSLFIPNDVELELEDA
jgi:hypothetical protein